MGICINVLAPPWGICNIFVKKKSNARDGGGGMRAVGIDRSIIRRNHAHFHSNEWEMADLSLAVQ